MSDRKLTDKQRTALFEDLRSSWSWWNRGNPWDRIYSLGTVLGEMRELGLRQFQGCTYAEIKSLYSYLSRTFYNRRLTIRLQDMAHNARVGDLDLPHRPTVQVIRFALESHDNSRELICELKFIGDTSTLTRDGLTIDLTDKLWEDSLSGGIAVMHYRSTNDGRRYTCYECGDRRCYQTRVYPDDSGVTTIVDAWKLEGPEGVWKVLDRAWIDLLPARPRKRPLSQAEIRTRWHVLRNQPVRVITSKEPYFGDLEELQTEGRKIKSVKVVREQWEPLGNTGWPVDIPASDIIEILPARDNRDPVFGFVSYL